MVCNKCKLEKSNQEFTMINSRGSLTSEIKFYSLAAYAAMEV